MAIEAVKWVCIAVGALVLGIIACYFLIQLIVYIMYALFEIFRKGM